MFQFQAAKNNLKPDEALYLPSPQIRDHSEGAHLSTCYVVP